MLSMLLAVSVSLHLLGPPEVRVYADPGDATDDAAIRAAACPYLTLHGVPGPVPVVLYRWKRVGEGPVYVAERERAVMLGGCP
jgi:hypothetical protein